MQRKNRNEENCVFEANQTRDTEFLLTAGTRKRADSYFPPEERVRLVRLVSHGELPGEMSGDSTIQYS